MSAVVVLVLVAAAGWLVGFSSMFAARQVQVSGVRALSVDQVRAAAAVPLGRPLVRQDINGIATRVAGLRLVRSVQVSRSWPGTVRIEVQERTAVLALRQADGFGLVDGEGQLYSTVTTVPKHVVMAEVAAENAALLGQVATVASALPPELARRVATIAAATADSIELTLTDGDTVRWGSAEESAVKAQVLTALLKQRATRYDVSAPRSPALR